MRRKPRDPNKPKPDFMGGYKKRYNPAEEGFGNASQWRAAFTERMGVEQAKVVVGERSPWDILEVSRNASWDDVVKSYRKLVRKYHPHTSGRGEETSGLFQDVQAAYELLEERYKQ